MPSLDKRLTKIEDVVIKHLEESGTIRTDLAWLKRSYWTLAGIMGTAVMAEMVARLWK